MDPVLQKFIAETGYCSRRQAEKLIVEGLVELNGRKAVLGDRVNAEDSVKINGKKLVLSKENIYIKFNKPIGVTCTNRFFKNEKNVFDFVRVKERLFVAGRLDKNSRGLVILTNDGEFANRITHPRYEHEKKYEVGIIKQEARRLPDGRQGIKQEMEMLAVELMSGVEIGEGDGVVRAVLVKYLGGNRFEVVLGEGKKRQIRRMFGALGYEVEDLVRTKIGEIELGKMKESEWEHFKIN